MHYPFVYHCDINILYKERLGIKWYRLPVVNDRFKLVTICYIIFCIQENCNIKFKYIITHGQKYYSRYLFMRSVAIKCSDFFKAINGYLS